MSAAPPLVLHVVYRFDTGGLENGVVNLINRLDGYRHAVLALTECADAFTQRVQRPGTAFVSLHKPAGQGMKVAPAFAQALRQLRPDVVHTRNLAALEMQLPTWWTGIGARVHGEHGRDADDLDGTSRKHRWMRRAFRPFVQRYVALSGELEGYLHERVGVPQARIARICNGVDTARFHPAQPRQLLVDSPFNDPACFVFGTVGRMATVKAQTDLVDAFVQAVRAQPLERAHWRLVLVGDGPLRAECARRLAAAGLAERAWLPGDRRDIPDLMRSFDAFVLPSWAEGISNTVLEAMASGLPVVATRVGGNAELVDDGRTGRLVPPAQAEALAAALVAVAGDPSVARAMGATGRARALAQFSLDAMVSAYDSLYRGLLRPAPLQ